MNIKAHLSKRNDEPIVIVPVVKRCVKVVFVKAMEKRLTTSDHTAQAAYVMYQLVWSVGMRIGYGNLSALEAWVKSRFM